MKTAAERYQSRISTRVSNSIAMHSSLSSPFHSQTSVTWNIPHTENSGCQSSPWPSLRHIALVSSCRAVGHCTACVPLLPTPTHYWNTLHSSLLVVRRCAASTNHDPHPQKTTMSSSMAKGPLASCTATPHQHPRCLWFFVRLQKLQSSVLASNWHLPSHCLWNKNQG